MSAFAPFRAAVATHFAPVAARLGLAPGPEAQFPSELHVEFRGHAGRLVVSYEPGGPPWAEVVVPTAGGHERHFGLHTIVEQRERSLRAFDELAKIGDLDQQVRVLADLARRYAGSVLVERTADLRELYLLRAKRLHEHERETGFDRSAEPRPPLAMLFEACGPDDRAICVYHAVVDDAYSPDEMAAFLRVGTDDVQRMIEAHDTIRR